MFTSNPPGAATPVGAPLELSSGTPATGLPDDLFLTRLASEMFRALPGGALPSASGIGGGEPAAPPVAAAAPVWLSPSASPPAATTMPAHGVPAGGFGAAPPSTPLPGVPPQAFSNPTTAPARALATPRPALAPEVPAIPGVPPLAASIPGTEDLAALLSPRLTPASAGAPSLPATPDAPLYFLEGKTPPAQHANATPPVAGSTAHPTAHPPFDAHRYRRDFPILNERVNGRPLIWLDNAATTQKPQSVIDRLVHFYEHENSNIHRAAHELAARATDAYEAARDKVRRFLNAASTDEIVFVRGATEAINLVAQSWGRQNLVAGDEIVITWLEHHANIVPWQRLAAETGAKLRVAPVDDRGQVRLEVYESLLGPRTRLVAFTQVSNALGTVTPARTMVEMARRYGAHVLVDGAQAVSHMRADVQALDCDWYVVSGHKMFGPTGIGVLYGKKAVLAGMPPWQGGGNMIKDVTFDRTEYHAAPARFEAGTGNIADAVGLGAAIDYLDMVGMENVSRHEHALLIHATRLLEDIGGLRLIGTAPEKAGVLSFVLDGLPAEQVGKALNREGIAVRSGHHCAQPILRRFGLEATVRPSLAFYNTFEDIDALAAALRRIRSGAPLPR